MIAFLISDTHKHSWKGLFFCCLITWLSQLMLCFLWQYLSGHLSPCCPDFSWSTMATNLGHYCLCDRGRPWPSSWHRSSFFLLASYQFIHYSPIRCCCNTQSTLQSFIFSSWKSIKQVHYFCFYFLSFFYYIPLWNLHDMICIYSSVVLTWRSLLSLHQHTPTHSLQSVDANCLVPITKTKWRGPGLLYCRPLPLEYSPKAHQESNTLSSFKCSLKMHLL